MLFCDRTSNLVQFLNFALYVTLYNVEILEKRYGHDQGNDEDDNYEIGRCSLSAVCRFHRYNIFRIILVKQLSCQQTPSIRASTSVSHQA